VQKRAVKVLDFDLHGSPYTHTKANVALNTIFLVLSIERNGPLLEHIELTDKLIDQIVYKLYGLTEEEIEIVERQG
jgi:hypothetical protein